MYKELHFVRDNEVCVGQGLTGWEAVLWKNMLDLLHNVNSDGAKMKQRCIYFSNPLSLTAARILGNTSWPASLPSLGLGPNSLL